MNKKTLTLLLIASGLFVGGFAAATDYCSMSVLGPSTTDYIARVVLTGDSSTLDNTTTGSFNGPNYYELFSGGDVIVPTLTEGQNYTISIQIGTRNLSSVAAWIDFNGDGTFSTSERLGQTAAVASNGFATYSFTAPSSLSGMSRLRVLDLWMSASLAYFGGSIPGCGAITITQGEIEDYNVNLIGTYTPPSVGGGARRVIPVDFCPAGDFSPTQYDGLCAGMSINNGVTATGTIHPNVIIIAPATTSASTVSTGVSNSATGTTTTTGDIFTEVATGGVGVEMDMCTDADMQSAFTYGTTHGLIDFETCLLARMTDGLTRIEAAKMISIFATKILDRRPNYDLACPFEDMVNTDKEAQKYALMACQLGLMGLRGEGAVATTFNPDALIDKAQISTILSRLLYGNTNNSNSCRYCKHVNALKANGIINVTTDLFAPLKRGRALLMLMRINN